MPLYTTGETITCAMYVPRAAPSYQNKFRLPHSCFLFRLPAPDIVKVHIHVQFWIEQITLDPRDND